MANSVFSTMFAGLFGAWKNYRIGHFYPQVLLAVGIPAVTAAVGVTMVLATTHFYSLDIFSLFFAIVLIPMVVRMFYARNHQKLSVTPNALPRWGLVFTGLVSGAVTALSGLGGGVVMIPALNGLMKFPIRKTIAVSLGVIGMVSLGLTGYNLLIESYEVAQFQWAVGFIVFPMVIPVIIGVMLAVNWGVTLAQRIPAFWIKVLFVMAAGGIVGNLLYDAYF
jgi:uncharacterized membrane protein YfcA